jgi:excisionase family DNA binding protein
MERLTKKMGELSTWKAGSSPKETNRDRGPGALNIITQAHGLSNKKLVYSVQELCDVLGISLSTAYEALRRGTIYYIRISKCRYLIPRAAIAAMLTPPEGIHGEQ